MKNIKLTVNNCAMNPELLTALQKAGVIFGDSSYGVYTFTAGNHPLSFKDTISITYNEKLKSFNADIYFTIYFDLDNDFANFAKPIFDIIVNA